MGKCSNISLPLAPFPGLPGLVDPDHVTARGFVAVTDL